MTTKIKHKPQTIGTYVIEKTLQRNSHGTIYLAHHANIKHARTLITVLHRQAPRSSKQAQDFFLEVKKLARLAHPGLARLHDYGYTDDGHIYIATEHTGGELLSQRLGRLKHLTEESVLSLARQISDALATAHTHGITHGDLNPRNIVLAEQRLRRDVVHIKILGFDVARINTEKKGDTRLRLGPKPNTSYMAPELLRGHWYSAAADLYSLGLVMYECLCGVLPFPSDSLDKIYEGHLALPPKPIQEHRTDISAPTNDLILSCLEKDPALRPPSMEEVYNAIVEISKARTQEVEVIVVADGSPPPSSKAREIVGAIVEVAATLGLEQVRSPLEIEGSWLKRIFFEKITKRRQLSTTQSQLERLALMIAESTNSKRTAILLHRFLVVHYVDDNGSSVTVARELTSKELAVILANSQLLSEPEALLSSLAAFVDTPALTAQDNSPKPKQLATLLTEIFNMADLRVFACDKYPDIASRVHWNGSVYHTSFEFACALQKHGLITNDLRIALQQERPHRCESINKAWL